MLAAFASVAKAIGNEHRLDLLEHLAQGERTVEGLAQRVGIPLVSVSQHLQALRKSGLVVARREGRYVFYSIADDGVLRLIAALRDVAERQVADVDRIVSGYFRDRDSLEAVSRQELQQRLRDGLVTVLDVRPEDEFAEAHLPGAVNIPLSQLTKRIGELPQDVEVVAYCRGPWCVLAFEAVALLRENGRSARRLEGGLPEWRIAGLPVHTTKTARAESATNTVAGSNAGTPAREAR
jgi:rhodanese-related sulfurtransferase/DNA-binding transcriptional ArsR family regulator